MSNTQANKMNKKLKNSQKSNTNKQAECKLKGDLKVATTPSETTEQPSSNKLNTNNSEIAQTQAPVTTRTDTPTTSKVAASTDVENVNENEDTLSSKKVDSVIVSVKNFSEKSELDEVTVSAKE